jgi:hypothetical protein
MAAAPAAARAGWGKPFELVKPAATDYLPTELAFSSSGASAASFATEDADTSGSSQAFLVLRSAGGRVGAPRKLTGVSQTLALAYAGSKLELLTGETSGSLECCSSAQAVGLGAGGNVLRRQSLIGGLTGDAFGQLVPLAGNRMLAVVATDHGVWATQSSRSLRFAPKRRLTSRGQSPEALTATSVGGASSLVAWTAASGPPGSADPRSIFYAEGSKRDGPRRSHTLLRTPAGHRVDQLGVARRGSGATAAWVESFYDRRGGYHSNVRAADFASKPQVRTLSSSGSAADLSFAGNPAGAQAVAWSACTGSGTCTVHVARRGPSGRFGSGVSLGSIDASQSPSVAVGPHGQVVVGWVRSGHPVAAVGSASGGRFGNVRVLSASVFALDLTVAFGPRRDALVAWTQGTLNPSVVADDYHAG